MTSMHLKTVLAAATLAVPTPCDAAPVTRVAVQRKEARFVELAADTGIVRVSVLTPEIIRVQGTARGRFAPSLLAEAGFVKTDWPASPWQVRDEANQLALRTAALEVRIRKSPFAFQVCSQDGASLLKTAGPGALELGEGTSLALEMTAADHFFGFGYMRKCLDARGQTLTWTRTYRNNEATVPFFMNPRGYAFLSNNTWKNDFDFTGASTFRITTVSGDLDFFLMVGPDFKRLLDLYTDLTGKPQLAPKWALALEHRARYYDEAMAVLETARQFRQHDIPCEIIALEPGWEETPYSMQWKWSSARFPDPQGMIRQLKGMGYRFDLWESGQAPKKDLLDPAVRKAWFAKRAVALADWGVDMFKQDDPYPRAIQSVGMEPAVLSDGGVSDRTYAPGEIVTVANTFYSHTLFTEWGKLTGRRPVVQFHAYNASVASQRWPYQWAGDFGTGWGLLNASLSGHAMANADARSPDLDSRHLDFFMSAGPVNDCWAYTIEPWDYSDRLLEGCRMYASLRARLYPYLYSALRESHETGLPILRPMVLVDPRDPATYNLGTQFVLGDSLLVATSVRFDASGNPVKQKVPDAAAATSQRSTPVYLPQGTWIDYWTGRQYVAASSRWTDCPFPSWAGGPLLVKQGAILPTAQVKHYTEQWPDEILTLDIYPGVKPASYRLYEDDGNTFGYRRGELATTTLTSARAGDTITVDLGRREGDYPGKPTRRDYLLKVHSPLAPAAVVVDGQPLPPQTKDALLFSSASRGWYYDAGASKIIIKRNRGWHYAISNRNPAGTLPLTPAEEAVTVQQKTDHSSRASRVEIRLNRDPKARIGPARQIRLAPENTRVLADGQSQVRIPITICDASGNVVPGYNGTVRLRLEGGGRVARSMAMKRGRGEVIYTAPSEPGTAQLVAESPGLVSRPRELEAAHGVLRLVVNPRTKVPMPGKGEWLARRFTIAVSVRDAQGHRLAAQRRVRLGIRDYRDREVIEREARLVNGEAEFCNIPYKTRPEKFIITAGADGLTSATFRAFANGWHLPDDYMTNEGIKDGLEKVLKH